VNEKPCGNNSRFGHTEVVVSAKKLRMQLSDMELCVLNGCVFWCNCFVETDGYILEFFKHSFEESKNRQVENKTQTTTQWSNL